MSAVLDTHTALWSVFDRKRISQTALQATAPAVLPIVASIFTQPLRAGLTCDTPTALLGSENSNPAEPRQSPRFWMHMPHFGPSSTTARADSLPSRPARGEARRVRVRVRLGANRPAHGLVVRRVRDRFRRRDVGFPHHAPSS